MIRVRRAFGAQAIAGILAALGRALRPGRARLAAVDGRAVTARTGAHTGLTNTAVPAPRAAGREPASREPASREPASRDTAGLRHADLGSATGRTADAVNRARRAPVADSDQRPQTVAAIPV